MKRWIITLIIMTLVATCGVGMLFAQGATADQYRAAGDKFFAAKDYAKAYQYYGAAVKLNPNDAAANKGIGNCLYMYQKKDQAIQYYEKSLALNPTDAQLSGFIQKLKGQAPATAAAGAPVAVSQSLTQGKALFQQKQYATAIPYLQQATKESPTYEAFYMLGYSQYMTRDAKGAAANFGIANVKQPNPTLKSYSDKLRAGLPPADQQWVDAQIATGGVVATASVIKPKTIGFRLSPGIMLYTLKDFSNEGDAIQAELKKANAAVPAAFPVLSITPEDVLSQGVTWMVGTAGQYTMTGEVPEGAFGMNGEIFFRVSPAVEIALGVGVISSFGEYKIDITSPNVSNASLTDTISSSTKVSTMPIGLSLGYVMGSGNVQPRISAGADYYSVTIKRFLNATSYSAAMGDMTGSTSGDYKTTGIGGHVELACDFKLSPSFLVSPYVRYRMAKFTSFTGEETWTQTNTGGIGNPALSKTGTMTGTLVVDGTTQMIKVSKTPLAADRPVELDLGCIQAGLSLALMF